MKRAISFLLILISLFINNCVFANNNIKYNFNKVDEYQYKTLLKHYVPYSIGLVNNNSSSVLFSSATKIKYVDNKGNEYFFPDDIDVYIKSRKRDIGRYCWVQMPAAVIGGGITGITFGLGIVLGIGVVIAGEVPWLFAVKYNSKLSENIFVENKIPLTLEPKTYEMIYVFLPKKNHVVINKVIITNLSLKGEKPFDLIIPVRGESL